MNSKYSKSSRPLTDLQSCIINANQSFGDASCKLIWISSMIWTNSNFLEKPPMSQVLRNISGIFDT